MVMTKIKSFEEELKDSTDFYTKKIENLEKWTEEQILKGKMSENEALEEIENVNKQFNARVHFLHIKHIQGFIEPTVDPEDETIASYTGKKPIQMSKVNVNFSPQGIFKA